MLLTKWSSDLKYGPCPPIRDLCSRVSGLVKLWRFSISDWRSEIALLCPSIRQSFSPSVRLSVHWLVGHTFLFYDFYFWTLLLLPKWSSVLKYGPCPPTRNLCSRVSGLVKLWRFSITDWRSEIQKHCIKAHYHTSCNLYFVKGKKGNKTKQNYLLLIDFLMANTTNKDIFKRTSSLFH